uniref:hypothetical protein n=1 Tax=Pseudomonas viridiflava TaxID=33069 RepID=UPI00197F11AB
QAQIIQAAIAERCSEKHLGLGKEKIGLVSQTSHSSTQRRYAILLLADCPAACSTFRNVMVSISKAAD